VTLDPLPRDHESELVETAEDSHIGRVEGSVEHVEVLLGW
jgi:hypothetical protein